MKKCCICKIEMTKPPKYSYKQWSKAKCCGKKCADISQSITSKGIRRSPSTEIKKGQRLSTKTEFKKGEVAYMTGKKLYNGDKSYYRKIHIWIRKQLGSPKTCESCGETKLLVWANKSQKYLEDTKDWMSLCRSCHMKHDHKLIKEKYV